MFTAQLVKWSSSILQTLGNAIANRELVVYNDYCVVEINSFGEILLVKNIAGCQLY